MSKGTPGRMIRVPDDVWEAAKRKAEALGYGTASDFVQAALGKLAEHEAGTGRVVVTPPRR
jgi:Arc/MetJ-type ribon-helix-helix transcriptional regulator